jgi:hypothetical protein
VAWNPIDAPINYILLTGQKSPGIADVEGASSPRKWDERNGYGLSGSTVVFTGLGLAKFVVRLRFYTAEHWAAWAVWQPLVAKPPMGSRPRALDIWHPHLEELGIKSVVVEDVSQPKQTADGEWTVEIKFIQWRRPKLALAKPEGSQAKPTDPYDQLIERLTTQVQELAAE